MEQKYFRKNGKCLKSFDRRFDYDFFYKRNNLPEEIFSLADINKACCVTKPTLIYTICANLGNRINAILESTYFETKQKTSSKLAFAWISASTTAFALLVSFTLIIPFKVTPERTAKQYSFTSRPLEMEAVLNDVYSKDSRSQRINEVFKYYKCPLEGMGEVFVHEADKNDIPWWIVASIAFQESSCGKNTPKAEGQESYNAWGWAVYGSNVQTFDNWARGVDSVSKYLGQKFFSKGISETCEIMKVYTPPSNGSWCRGVNYFGDIIQNYKSPESVASATR